MTNQSNPQAHTRAFLDFYGAHGISPVHQDISDLRKHFRRRDALYRFLGLPASFIRDRAVIEFGPGSGHNALFTASHGPKRYVLVDGNPKGVAETQSLLAEHQLGTSEYEVIESYFEDFASDDEFDLVLAEGFLSFQRDPAGLLRKIAGFVRPGGLLFITTMSPVSYLSEIIRRLIRDVLIDHAAPPEEQLAVLRPIMAPHLECLNGRSRPIDDWLLDNIVQPTPGPMLSIDQAVRTLAGDFDVHGASPNFMVDLRWYKAITDTDRGFNSRCTEQYFRHALNFLDYRLDLPAHDGDLGRWLDAKSNEVWNDMQAIQWDRDADRLASAIETLDAIAGRIRQSTPTTAAAINEAASHLKRRADFTEMQYFPSFWGRGQQYLSFIRRTYSATE